MNANSNVHWTYIQRKHSVLTIEYWMSPFDCDDFEIRRVEMLGDPKARNLLGAVRRHRPWERMCVNAVVAQIAEDA
jgi:hypothetical protein